MKYLKNTLKTVQNVLISTYIELNKRGKPTRVCKTYKSPEMEKTEIKIALICDQAQANHYKREIQTCSSFAAIQMMDFETIWIEAHTTPTKQ